MDKFDNLVIPSPEKYAGFLSENSNILEYHMFVDSWNGSNHYHNKRNMNFKEGGEDD